VVVELAMRHRTHAAAVATSTMRLECGVRFRSTGFGWTGLSRDEEFEIGFIGRMSTAPFYCFELVAAMSVVV
jgi:hypothetical protein